MQESSPKIISNKETIMCKIIDEIERSKESTRIMRNLILHRSLNDDDLEFQKELEHHSLIVLNSINSSLSMLRSCDFEGNIIKKRKTSTLSYQKSDRVKDDHHQCHGESTTDEFYPLSKNKRGCYKRRRYGQSRVIEVTQLSEDGFAWRKYGQKQILKSKHPRNYYRCTHKHEQNCQATKQVQLVTENPTKYMIIYHGNHTCDINNNINFLKHYPFTLHSRLLFDHHSSNFLSFDQSYNNNNNNNNNNNIEYSPCSDLTAITEPSPLFMCDQNDEIISAVDHNNANVDVEMEEDYYSYLMRMADTSEELLNFMV